MLTQEKTWFAFLPAITLDPIDSMKQPELIKSQAYTYCTRTIWRLYMLVVIFQRHKSHLKQSKNGLSYRNMLLWTRCFTGWGLVYCLCNTCYIELHVFALLFQNIESLLRVTVLSLLIILTFHGLALLLKDKKCFTILIDL